jgi:hypothetical protein
MEQAAEQLCRRATERIRPALVGYRNSFLSEDYLVYVLNELDAPTSGDDLISEHGEDIALMLRGGRRSARRRRTRSYVIVFPTWSTI